MKYCIKNRSPSISVNASVISIICFEGVLVSLCVTRHIRHIQPIIIGTYIRPSGQTDFMNYGGGFVFDKFKFGCVNLALTHNKPNLGCCRHCGIPYISTLK